MLLETSGSLPLLHAFLIFGITVSLFAPLSGWLKSRALIAEPLLATAVGVLFGLAAPKFLDAHLNFTALRSIALEVGRITIAIQVLNSGLKVRKSFYRCHWPTLVSFLTIVMLFMWFSSWGFVQACFPHLSTVEAALIGAMLAPTDPVLASSIVRGHESGAGVPTSLKELIIAESAANDGLALPLVYLPLLLILSSPPSSGIGVWFYDVWAYQVLLGAFIGAVAGAAAALLLNAAVRHNLPDKESRLAFEIALALGVLGGVQAMGSDGILACFTAGLAFYWVQHLEHEPELESEATTADALDILLTFSFFIYLGFVFPWAAWGRLGVGRLFLLSFAVLLFTRLPIVLLLKAVGLAPVLKSYSDAAFVGWFGPVGVAAVYYAADAFEQTGGRDDTPFEIVTFVVLIHTVVFSVTGPLGTRWYTHFHPAPLITMESRVDFAAVGPPAVVSAVDSSEESSSSSNSTSGRGSATAMIPLEIEQPSHEGTAVVVDNSHM
jgi:NhaP-type Na+/H+ or K+/H+ antiporter